MIKKTLCFSNPAYLSLRDAQLVIKLPEVEKADNLTEDFKKSTEVTRPIEDIGVVVLSHKQITITQGALEALLENNCAVITCDSKSMPVGLLLPLVGNTTQSVDSEINSMHPYPYKSNYGNKPCNIKSEIKQQFSTDALTQRQNVCKYGQMMFAAETLTIWRLVLQSIIGEACLVISLGL